MVCNGLAEVGWTQAIWEGSGAELGLRLGRDRQKEEQMAVETDRPAVRAWIGVWGKEAGRLCGEERHSEV